MNRLERSGMITKAVLNSNPKHDGGFVELDVSLTENRFSVRHRNTKELAELKAGDVVRLTLIAYQTTLEEGR